MKKLRLLLAVVILLMASDTMAASLHLDWIAAVDPPHNENIVGRGGYALAERYYLEVTPSLDWLRLHTSLAISASGDQQWHPGTYWGGTYQYYSNREAWSVGEWRYSIRSIVRFDLVDDNVQIYSDYYMPLDRGNYDGVYYWRVGFSGRFF